MSFFGQQDGTQGNVGSANIQGGLYNPLAEDATKVEWGCPPQYPPNDCNRDVKWTIPQIQSLLSNIFSGIASLARFKNKITGTKEVIPSCNDGLADNVLGSYLDYLTSQVFSKDELANEIAKIGCPTANGGAASLPLADDAILIIRKGATAGAPCTVLSTNLNAMAMAQYNLMPLIEVTDLSNNTHYHMWQNSNINATEALLDLAGNVRGYVSLTPNSWATVQVTDLSVTPSLTFYAAP
jgi:hypothetical protein